MSKTGMNLQDSFLNQVRRESAEVLILLTNGTELRGLVKGFDSFTLVLVNKSGQHLVYKHAIAHVRSKRHIATKHEEHIASNDAQTDNISQSVDSVTEVVQDEVPAVEIKKSNSKKSDSKKEGFNTMDFKNLKLNK